MIRVLVLGSTASPCKSNSTSSVGTIKPISGREDRPPAGTFFLLWAITGFFIGSRGVDDSLVAVVDFGGGGDSVVDFGGGATVVVVVVVVGVVVVVVGVLVTANVLSRKTF